ncbi:hypothetical protein HDV02_004224 [Globomyces sp. JEL0801]|nr:hypothetical protein HDV02_004224 [Globomyces sp. JEL0801]
MQPSLDETWPDFYSFAVQETPIGFCGGLSVALVHDCCISSLDLDSSFGIASGAAMIVPDNDFDYALSHYASGGNYCVLQADEFGLVNGYHALDEIVGVTLTRELSKISSIGLETGPWHDSHWDRLQHACIYTSIFGDVIILAYAIYRFRKIKKRVLLVPVTTCFVWLLSNSFSGYFALTIAPDIDTQYYLLEVVLSLQNFATLLTVAQTTITILNLTTPSPTKVQIILGSVGIRQCIPFWYLFVFLYDIIPPILIVYQMSRVDRRTFWELVLLDLKFTFGLSAQIFICVFYFTINYIQSSTDLLGSDAGFASVITLSCTLITLHSQMNMFTLSRLGVVLNKFSNKLGSSMKSTAKKP